MFFGFAIYGYGRRCFVNEIKDFYDKRLRPSPAVRLCRIIDDFSHSDSGDARAVSPKSIVTRGFRRRQPQRLNIAPYEGARFDGGFGMAAAYFTNVPSPSFFVRKLNCFYNRHLWVRSCFVNEIEDFYDKRLRPSAAVPQWLFCVKIELFDSLFTLALEYPKAYKGTRYGAVCEIFDFANSTYAKISCEASHIMTKLSS